MKAITKLPGEDMKFDDVDASLAGVQALVGGYVQEVPIGNGVVLLCDEEALLKERPVPNFAMPGYVNGIVHGPVVFLRTSRGDWSDIRPEDMERLAYMMEVL